MLKILKWMMDSFVDQEGHRALWNMIFVAAIVVTVCLFVYKADYTGTTYDESLTFLRFCDSIHTARHNFETPNNHVLNSIFIFFAKKLFAHYEQYIRVFPMLSGLIFFMGIAYIVRKIIASPAMQVAAIILIYYLPYVFNYLFMARGYTYGLSGIVLYIMLVFYLLDHPIAFRFWPIPVILFSLLNFYVLGSMLSGIYIMVLLNGLFVLFFSSRIYKDRTNWFFSSVLNAVAIAVLSGLLIYLFYRPILPQVMDIHNSKYLARTIKAWKGWPSLGRFSERLLCRQFYNVRTWGRHLYYPCLALISVSIVTYVVGFARAVKGRFWGRFLKENGKGFFLVSLVLLYFLILIIYGGVLGRCPGLERSHIFLLPLVGLAFVWLIENFMIKVSRGSSKPLLYFIIWLFVILTGLNKLPYLHSVGRRGMAMSRPTLTRLKELDPEKTWYINCSRKMYTYSMEFRYYQQFDTYKFNMTPREYCNVYICRKQDKPEEGICLDYDYFLNQNDCYVYLTIQPDWERMILQAKPIEQD